MIQDVQVKRGGNVHHGQRAARMAGTSGKNADDIHRAHLRSGGFQLVDGQSWTTSFRIGFHGESSFAQTLSQKTQRLWGFPRSEAVNLQPGH